MKQILAIITCVVFSFSVNAQTSTTKVNKKVKTTVTKSIASLPNTVNTSSQDALSLKESEYDFGKIPQGKPVTHIFEFTNTGSAPLTLTNVQASCGCTTPVWNKDTVAVGGTSSIKVGYNAANEGAFTKQVNITYNDNQTKQIIIKGEVWKTPETSAPVNTGLNSLKN
jgi:hypothetical protein